jgi:hypothetical protein
MKDFKVGERVIWDDDNRYEIGYFRGVGNSINEYAVKFMSGICANQQFSLPKEQIYPYSDELIDEISVQYGYEKKFSKVF